MEAIIVIIVFILAIGIIWYSLNKAVQVNVIRVPESVYRELEMQVKDILLDAAYVDRIFDVCWGDYVIEVYITVTCDLRPTTGGSDEYGNYEDLIEEIGRTCDVYKYRVSNVYNENIELTSDFDADKLAQMIEFY
jgi:hypothetical protein